MKMEELRDFRNQVRANGEVEKKHNEKKGRKGRKKRKEKLSKSSKEEKPRTKFG